MDELCVHSRQRTCCSQAFPARALTGQPAASQGLDGARGTDGDPQHSWGSRPRQASVGVHPTAQSALGPHELAPEP